jgi:ABC-type glycerol-3-phosphate transport system substrate-binding protein
MPETLDFNALVYRKDIFDSLDLMVPDTWDEVIDILPELQRYGMDFYHPIADGTTSLKWFYQTAPFVYLHGGKLYNDDGLTTAIDSSNSVEGINYLVNLFKQYSMPTQVMRFSNSFRYSTVPVGIVDFNNYLQIKNTAPELMGQWELSSYPGIEQEDGSIDRWFIANGTNGMIFNDSERKQESWEFLKWWMSTETQTTYSYNLQATFGPEFVWLSGNKNALANSPIENQHKQIIMESVEWIRDVPRTPGQYMLERGLSDIWNKAVFDDYTTRVAVDLQKLTVDREIERKMIEFGFIDKDGNQLKEFTIRDIDWVQEQIRIAKGAE